MNLTSPFSDPSKFSSEENFMNQAIDDMSNKINNAHYLAIVEALKVNGFSFETSYELHTFAKTRCTITVRGGSSVKSLWVDFGTEKAMMICSWDEIKSKMKDGKMEVYMPFELKRNITLQE
jgi:hypothetical protein